MSKPGAGAPSFRKHKKEKNAEPCWGGRARARAQLQALRDLQKLRLISTSGSRQLVQALLQPGWENWPGHADAAHARNLWFRPPRKTIQGRRCRYWTGWFSSIVPEVEAHWGTVPLMLPLTCSGLAANTRI